MKPTILLFSLLFTLCSTALSQNSELTKEQIQAIQNLINTFKTKNKSKIAELIYYPLRREYPLKDVKNKGDLIQRFDEIIDNDFMRQISLSKIKDWSDVGWRGIMFKDGIIWIDEDGKIMSINYQSQKEKQLLVNTIQEDKSHLPKSLQDFVKPVYIIITKNYKIRIDEKSGNNYRYAVWKIKAPKIEPEIIIEKGVLEFDGSGGNHTITFKNNGFTYIISINEMGTDDTPDATLEIVKQGKTLLTEDGKIIRN